MGTSPKEPYVEKTMLIVDAEKNTLNELASLFRKEGYNVLSAESGQEGLDLLDKNMIFAVISGYSMPTMDGIEFLSKVKDASPDTPRLMLIASSEIKTVMSTIKKGEVHRCIPKPWNDEEIKRVIREAMERAALMDENKRLKALAKKLGSDLLSMNKGLEAKAEEAKKLKENFLSFVRIFTDVVELHDQNIGGHSKRVAALARGLSKKMGLTEEQSELLETAALLHNIGLVGVPKEILDKEEDTLTVSERALLKHNPKLSQHLISPVETLRQAGAIIRSHMERYDGRGYPDGLKGEEINTGSKILAVCKMYDRLRHSRKKINLLDIISRIKEEKGLSLDPAITDAFLEFILSHREEEAAHGADEMKIAVIAIPITAIREGMILGGNLVTSKGKLLVTKGTALTDALIEKVINFHRIDPITDSIYVVAESAGS